MQLKAFKCLLGVPKIDEEAFGIYKNTGYDGIEFKALNAFKYDGFAEWLKNLGFDFIAQIHTGGTTVDEHLHSFEGLLNTSLSFNPILINSQSGCDYWNVKQKCHFIEGALRWKKSTKFLLHTKHNTIPSFHHRHEVDEFMTAAALID